MRLTDEMHSSEVAAQSVAYDAAPHKLHVAEISSWNSRLADFRQDERPPMQNLLEIYGDF